MWRGCARGYLVPMPIHEFACAQCAHQFELLVRKETVPQCPACGADGPQQLLSLPAVRSDQTHAAALRAARQRDSRQGAERMAAQRDYERSHND